MTHAAAFDFLVLLGREVERVAQKDIPVPLIAGIAVHNRLESFGESNFLHKQKTRVSKRATKDNRQSCKEQPLNDKRNHYRRPGNFFAPRKY